MQHLNGKMRRRAKPKEPNFLSRLHARYPQAAKSNNARAQERRSIKRIECRGQRKNKIRASRGKLRVPAIHAISSERRRIAEILEIVPAIPARAVRAANPRHTNVRPNRECAGSSANNFSDDLMPRNQRRAQRGQLAFDNMQISPANSAGQHPQENLSRGRPPGRATSSIRKGRSAIFAGE